MKITVSGPPGSGTTTLARFIAEKHKFELISAGELFRDLATEKGLSVAEFGELAETDITIDALIDVRQKETAKTRDNIVVEGRLSGWMVEEADLRIWLNAPIACRAKRIATRDGMDEYTARELTLQREESERRRYRNYYKIEIDDLSPYHLAMNSELWSGEALADIVDLAIGHLKK
ncbi:MAG TPA: AAA family ATPase [Methanomicrobiales archaeon]|nr:AAA family ATPase [Methanomicrobiales archaeon]